jgi:hypothetical protein
MRFDRFAADSPVITAGSDPGGITVGTRRCRIRPLVSRP